ALYCGHRTSTFLSCAFCEQEGHLAAPPPLLLLDCPEQPLPIRCFHEGPDLAGFRRSLLDACHDIAWLSPLLLQRQIIVPGTPAQPCRHVARRLFGPGFQNLRTEEHHIVYMVLDVLTRIVGKR